MKFKIGSGEYEDSIEVRFHKHGMPGGFFIEIRDDVNTPWISAIYLSKDGVQILPLACSDSLSSKLPFENRMIKVVNGVVTTTKDFDDYLKSKNDFVDGIYREELDLEKACEWVRDNVVDDAGLRGSYKCEIWDGFIRRAKQKDSKEES